MIYLQIIMFLAAFVGLMWYMLRVTVRHKGPGAEVCAGCGYSLIGTTDPPCPECGRDRRLDDPKRLIAGKRDTAGMISHTVAVAIAASLVSMIALELSPERVEEGYSGQIGISRSNEQPIAFSGQAQDWHFPPGQNHARMEPERIRFELGSRGITLVRDLHSSGWLDSSTGRPAAQREVMAALGAVGVEAGIQRVLEDPWSVMVTGQLQGHWGRPAGVVYAEIDSYQMRSATSIVPLSALLLITWGLAVVRIVRLLRRSDHQPALATLPA